MRVVRSSLAPTPRAPAAHARSVARSLDDRYDHLVECVQLSQRYTERRSAELEEAIGSLRGDMQDLRVELSLLNGEQGRLDRFVEDALAGQAAQLMMLKEAVAAMQQRLPEVAAEASWASHKVLQVVEKPAATCAADHTVASEVGTCHYTAERAMSSAASAGAADPVAATNTTGGIVGSADVSNMDPSHAATRADVSAEAAVLRNREGHAANQRGDTKAAKWLFLEAHALSPDDPSTTTERARYLFSAANMCIKLAELESAAVLLRKLVALPNLEQTLRSRAQAKLADLSRALLPAASKRFDPAASNACTTASILK